MGILRADLLTHSQLGSAGGSVVFDGSGDYLTIPNHSAFHFTGDYTIDFYIKFSTFSGTQRIFGQRNSDASDLSVLGEFASNNFYYYYSQNGTNSENIIIGSSGSSDETKNLELNTWYHVAIVSNGGVHHSYLNGVQTAVNVNNPPPLNDGDSTWSIGRQGAFTSNEFSGSIYGFRITQGALYKNNFTVSKFKPKVLPGTVLLCCVSSTSVTEAEVSVAGDITSNGDPQIGDTPLLKEDITDTGVVFDGFTVLATSTYMVPPGGNTRERNRGRGVLGGGAPFVSPNVLNNMSYVEVQSGGIFNDFGDLTVARGQFSAGQNASSTRGLSSGGWTSPVGVNTIDFITISNTANAIDFGDTTITRPNGVLSNQTRSLTASNGDLVDTIDFVTIATAGNASDFGNLLDARALVSGVSSPTRGVWGGGRNNTPSSNTEHNTLQYITIASTGDAQDFGDLTRTRYGMSGFSSSTRGIFAGGYSNPQGKINSIEFITIATLGNAIDFGDLTTTQGYGGSLTNSILGLITINNPSNYHNTIDFITISTTGNAKDFGDADPLGSGKGHGTFPSCMSDSHGGTT